MQNLGRIAEYEVCRRCCLRLVGVTQLEPYRERFEFSKAVVCALCQNILVMLDDPIFIEDIAEAINKEEYEFDHFKFNLKVPQGIAIRERQMALFLQKRHPQQFKQKITRVTELKTVFKGVLAPRLSMLCGKSSSIDCQDLVITIELTSQAEQQRAFGPFKQLIRWSQIQKYSKMGKAAPFSAKKIKDKPLEDKYCNAFNLKMILGLDDVFFFEQVLKEQRPTALASPDLTMSFNSRSAYLIGRYIKYSRHLPQTPWVLNGEAPFGTSIQEEVQRHILGRFYRPGDEPRLKFHSGGREDIDVRMLGEGRPFVLQVCNPRRIPLVADGIQEQINAGTVLVRVQGIRLTDSSCFEVLKQYQSEKIKAYCCVIVFEAPMSAACLEPLNAVVDLVLDQKTPLRVLHRRTLMVRHKVIHRLKVRQVSPTLAVLLVLSSAGTYIKEFVHGDLGRTTPNVGSLTGTNCDIMQLDVVGLYQSLNQEALAHFAGLHCFRDL